MTGNVVFVGFAVAGASGFALSASLSALVGFLCGAALGGATVERLGAHRGRLLAVVGGAELLLVVVALLVVALGGASLGTGRRSRSRRCSRWPWARRTPRCGT